MPSYSARIEQIRQFLLDRMDSQCDMMRIIIRGSLRNPEEKGKESVMENSVFLRYLLNATRVDSCAIREHKAIDLRFKLVEGKPVGGGVTEGRIGVLDPLFAQDRHPG